MREGREREGLGESERGEREGGVRGERGVKGVERKGRVLLLITLV